MNLVAEEYVTVQHARHGSGSLVLSEFTDAAAELRDAVPCNPFDVEGLSQHIEHALRRSSPTSRPAAPAGERATNLAASAPAFGRVVEAAGCELVRWEVPAVQCSGAGRGWGSADGSGGVRPSPEAFRPPVVAAQAGEFLSQPAGRHVLEAVDQAGDGDGGREVHQQVDVPGFPVELG